MVHLKISRSLMVFLTAVAMLNLGLLTACADSEPSTLVFTLDQAPSNNNQNNNNDGGGDQQGKSLFSIWEDSSGLFTIDLRQAELNGTTQVSATTAFNDQCVCDLELIGTEESGSANLSSCSGTSNCSLIERAGDYFNSSGTLQICESNNSCRIFY